MDDHKLTWTPINRTTVFSTRVFDVDEIASVSPEGDEHVFYSLEATDWVIVVPVLSEDTRDERFVMVRQWRHGSQALSIEFPGGVMDDGEIPEDAARRELTEETGYVARSMTLVCTVSPNPAIMGNRCHIFVAEGLSKGGGLEMDDDEYIDVMVKPVGEIIRHMGQPPLTHALMQSALFAYLQKKGRLAN
jgi:8-oxo-dGTP pyrophosphatase MutT (NUDIX family)